MEGGAFSSKLIPELSEDILAEPWSTQEER